MRSGSNFANDYRGAQIIELRGPDRFCLLLTGPTRVFLSITLVRKQETPTHTVKVKDVLVSK